MTPPDRPLGTAGGSIKHSLQTTGFVLSLWLFHEVTFNSESTIHQLFEPTQFAGNRSTLNSSTPKCMRITILPWLERRGRTCLWRFSQIILNWALVEQLFVVALHSVASFVVQMLSCVQLFVTPWTAARQNSLSFTISPEKTMAPHSSTLAWKIPWTEEPGRLQSMVSLRVGHNWATSLSFFTFMLWRRKWQPTPVFLPAESQGRGSLVGCCLWGRTESDMTEVTYLTLPSLSPRVYSNSGPSSWGCHPTISFCHPFVLLPLVFPSIRVFSNESALLIRWDGLEGLSFSISPSSEYSGLISFRIEGLISMTSKGPLHPYRT